MKRSISGDSTKLLFSSLAAPRHFTNRLRQQLSSEEQQRADRFRFEKHQTAFIIARGLLRILLGTYLDVEPVAIQFCYGSNGKPSVPDAPDLHFNISHSGEMVLYGFRQDRRIGVDVEHIRVVSNMEGIARRFFSAEEYRDLLTVPRGHRRKAFFDCWTRKEAFVKAVGDGLSYSLDRFRVALRPDQRAELISIDNRPGSEAGWSLYDIAPSESYAAAVILEDPPGDLQVRRFQTPQECAGCYL